MAPGEKLGEKLLDGPYLKAKLEKLYAPHLHTEALMDRWNKEAQAKAKSKKKPKEKPVSRRALRGGKEKLLVITDVKEIKEETHGKTKRRARKQKRRKKRDQQKDRAHDPRGERSQAGIRDSEQHVEGGQADTERGIHKEEEVILPCLNCSHSKTDHLSFLKNKTVDETAFIYCDVLGCDCQEYEKGKP